MTPLARQLEAILFIEPKPLKLTRLEKFLQVKTTVLTKAISELQAHYAAANGGLQLVQDGGVLQLTTASSVSSTVQDFLDDQQTAELTRPSLETLTIIAYRGPVSKDEIELIRGINCSLILRNLLMRGLVDEVGQTETGSPLYRVTVDFLKHLGVSGAEQLPDFVELNTNVHLQALLENKSKDFFA